MADGDDYISFEQRLLDSLGLERLSSENNHFTLNGRAVAVLSIPGPPLLFFARYEEQADCDIGQVVERNDYLALIAKRIAESGADACSLSSLRNYYCINLYRIRVGDDGTISRRT